MFFLQGLSGVPGQPGEPGKEGKRVSKQHQLAGAAACLVVAMAARCLVFWGGVADGAGGGQAAEWLLCLEGGEDDLWASLEPRKGAGLLPDNYFNWLHGEGGQTQSYIAS